MSNGSNCDGFSIPPRTQFRDLSKMVLDRYSRNHRKGERSFNMDLFQSICCYADGRPIPAKLAKSVGHAFFSNTLDELEKWMRVRRVIEKIPKQYRSHLVHVMWEVAEAASKQLVRGMCMEPFSKEIT